MEGVSKSLVGIFIGKKYNLNFVTGFDGSNIIINFSIHMYAKRMILHSFESLGPTLTLNQRSFGLNHHMWSYWQTNSKIHSKLKMNDLNAFTGDLVIQ
jgi:hypothetical protein